MRVSLKGTYLTDYEIKERYYIDSLLKETVGNITIMDIPTIFYRLGLRAHSYDLKTEVHRGYKVVFSVDSDKAFSLTFYGKRTATDKGYQEVCYENGTKKGIMIFRADDGYLYVK